MTTAIAKNLMADMKLLGMMSVFDQAVSDAPAIRPVTPSSSIPCSKLKPIAGKHARPAIASRRRDSRCAPVSRISDFTASRSISKAQVKEIYSLGVKEGRPLAGRGQIGVGKTFIARDVGLHACSARRNWHPLRGIRRKIIPDAFVDRRSQQPIGGEGTELYLGEDLRSHPCCLGLFHRNA